MPLRIACPTILDMEGGRALLQTVKKELNGSTDAVVLDLSQTERLDSGGGAGLIQIADYVHRRKAKLHWEGQQGQVADFMDLVSPSLQPQNTPKPERRGLFEVLGGTTLAVGAEAREFGVLIVDAIYWTVLAPFEGKGFRWGLLVEEIDAMGAKAVRIVLLMNFLLGLIIAMLSAKQVESFGLTIYVADLIIIAFARELAAIMTAVVVSARTGAAIAAEIATMKVQEEIDALRGMGLNVTQFIVAPRLLALIIVLPCLTALGMIAGIAGGFVWGHFVLDFSTSVWWRQTVQAAALDDMFQGMLKSIFFAAAIALIGCHNGLRVSGGSRGVGLMTTRAVVQDIFMLIVIDIVFATIFYYVLE